MLRKNHMKGAIVVILVVVAIIALVAVGLGQGGRLGLDFNHDQKWYKYCENLSQRIAQAYAQGYEPTNLIQQYGVCDQIAECQSHYPPSVGIGDPCVPKGEPPQD